MSASEREKQLARQEGFVHCFNKINEQLGANLLPIVHCYGGAEGMAAREYPLPTIARPRVLADPDSPCFQFRVGAHSIEVQDNKGGEWSHVRDMRATLTRVRVWADLLEKPTKEIEEPAPVDGAASPPKTHCDDCDRPELCDIIKRGTGPCGKNAGIGPAAGKVIEELKADARHGWDPGRHHLHCLYRSDPKARCTCSLRFHEVRETPSL